MLPRFESFIEPPAPAALKPARLRRNGGLRGREALLHLPQRVKELGVEGFG